jgi:biotin transport system substrate-specific component
MARVAIGYQVRGFALGRELCGALLGALFIGAAAQVAIPLPWTPVPLSLQTLAVLLVGASMGAKRGASSILTYLLMGILGLPVFAGGGFGVAKLLGPSGGYLIGFVAAAWVTGALVERGFAARPWKMALAVGAGQLLIWTMGMAWLGRFVGWENVLMMGLIPFLVGDALKVAFASVCQPAGRKLLSKLLGV